LVNRKRTSWKLGNLGIHLRDDISGHEVWISAPLKLEYFIVHTAGMGCLNDEFMFDATGDILKLPRVLQLIADLS
jgi:hypothetical protein